MKRFFKLFYYYIEKTKLKTKNIRLSRNVSFTKDTLFDSRTDTIRQEMKNLFLYKVIAIYMSYQIIPLYVKFLGVQEYGIWVTLLSITSWISFFDLGIGNGMKNQLTKAVSLKDEDEVNVIVSTGYFSVTIVSIFFFLFATIFTFNIKWNEIFNVNMKLLPTVIYVSIISSLLNFILSISKQMFSAYQKSSLGSLSNIITNFGMIIMIIIMFAYSGKYKLLNITLAYGGISIISNILLTTYFFRKHKEIRVSIKKIDYRKVKQISTLGIRFFVIQISSLIISTTDNLIIAKVLGSAEVTSYSIVFKLFSGITMLHSIISTPLWVAYTDALVKRDLKWIRKTLRKMNLLMIPLIAIVIILIFFARSIIGIWIEKELNYSNTLIILMGISVIISAWNNIYGAFLNGIGEVQLQMYLAIMAGVINIPLSIYFAKNLNLGNSGVILGSIISMLVYSVVIPITSYKKIKLEENISNENMV